MEESYTEAPVDCSGPHTSEVVAVPMLPAGVGYDASIVKLTRTVLEACRPVIEKRLGTSTRGFRLTA